MPIMLRAPSARPSMRSSPAPRDRGARGPRWRNSAISGLRVATMPRIDDRRPERREAGRHLLDHQAPQQHDDRDEEVEPGAGHVPGARQFAGSARSDRRASRSGIARRIPDGGDVDRDAGDARAATARRRRRRPGRPRCRNRARQTATIAAGQPEARPQQPLPGRRRIAAGSACRPIFIASRCTM